MDSVLEKACTISVKVSTEVGELHKGHGRAGLLAWPTGSSRSLAVAELNQAGPERELELRDDQASHRSSAAVARGFAPLLSLDPPIDLS